MRTFRCALLVRKPLVSHLAGAGHLWVLRVAAAMITAWRSSNDAHQRGCPRRARPGSPTRRSRTVTPAWSSLQASTSTGRKSPTRCTASVRWCSQSFASSRAENMREQCAYKSAAHRLRQCQPCWPTATAKPSRRSHATVNPEDSRRARGRRVRRRLGSLQAAPTTGGRTAAADAVPGGRPPVPRRRRRTGREPA
jgi:hypothetical protein